MTMTRRTALASAAGAAAIAGAGGVTIATAAAASGGDAELVALWRAWRQTWAEIETLKAELAELERQHPDLAEDAGIEITGSYGKGLVHSAYPPDGPIVRREELIPRHLVFNAFVKRTPEHMAHRERVISELAAELRRRQAAHAQRRRALGWSDRAERKDDAYDRLAEIEQAIERTPAAGLPGIAVKVALGTAWLREGLASDAHDWPASFVAGVRDEADRLAGGVLA